MEILKDLRITSIWFAHIVKNKQFKAALFNLDGRKDVIKIFVLITEEKYTSAPYRLLESNTVLTFLLDIR